MDLKQENVTWACRCISDSKTRLQDEREQSVISLVVRYYNNEFLYDLFCVPLVWGSYV